MKVFIGWSGGRSKYMYIKSINYEVINQNSEITKLFMELI